MTALKQYERLEALGIWREGADVQRREVICSFGDATLVIFDGRSNRPLAHWSLAALVRRNPGKIPALYAPSAEEGEDLEIEDRDMVAAIDKLQSALEARRPHPGRLRGLLIWAVAELVLAGLIWQLPTALIGQTARVTPAAKRSEIGAAILADIAKTTGSPCHSTAGDAALTLLSERLPGQRQIVILPRPVSGGMVLPGGVVAVDRRTITGPDSPAVIAGAVIATERAHAAEEPLLRFLKWAGVRAAAQLLVTGSLPEGTERGYGKVLLDNPPAPPDTTALIDAFTAAGVPTAPYAYALDASGESVLPLIEGDPFRGKPAPKPVLDEAQWISLQDICN
ncbi:hypothetical protein [Paenirhodobacter sp.]|uniref:hypothetical protein n=1 Tax=Paenirhodobacter sp. TaxID=1965326 RepID=UPI003B3ED90D